MLTKLQALKECKTLWMWLEKNPDRYKREWPGWKGNHAYISLCPCCEYAKDLNTWSGVDCRQCPLNDFAWSGLIGQRCMGSSSPFRQWLNTLDYSEKSAAAHKMVLACRRAIYKETK